ncbi:uncharacterized protein TM35_000051510 [Trypanosoma theileri]|uniref:Uncharacterized protein n=1 Tax=Trypanosoma theileri TaxID=67003 RepID=A0A1X0P3W7_9TRYP|nr:uncharacterized protein TM35_000051510 [Trypanosoma theileri]ORC91555.1 hypothetical protein TM35_000051510 [Trypanosoma theileri]
MTALPESLQVNDHLELFLKNKTAAVAGDEREVEVGSAYCDLSTETQTLSHLFDRLMEKLNETRRECRADRIALTREVETQLRDIRTSAVTTRSQQEQLQREMRALQEKLQNAALQRASTIRSSTDRLAVHTLAKTSQQLRRDAQQALSAVELLRTAVFHDRLTREERQKCEDEEDAEMELRLQHTETTTAALQRNLRRLHAENQQLTRLLQSIVGAVRGLEPQLAQQQRQVEETREAFHRLRAAHTRLEGTMESLIHHTEQYKASHDAVLRRLEKSVKELEQQVKKQQQQQQEEEERYRYGEGKRMNLITGNVSNSSISNSANKKKNMNPNNDRIEGGIINESRMWQQNNSGVMNNESTNRPLQQRLELFYRIYNPDKIPSIATIIEEYMGAEEELMAALEVHYDAFGFFSHY